MGNRLEAMVLGLSSPPDGPGVDVGEFYCVIGHGLLVERGDEYRNADGRFVPFVLEAVGRPVPAGLLARRSLLRS